MKTVLMILTVAVFSPNLVTGTPSPPQLQPTPQSPTSVSSNFSEPASQAPTSTGPSLQPAQVSDLLRKIYNSAYRVTDLVSLLQPDKWKMTESERKGYDESLDSLRANLKTLEESRSAFSGQPQNVPLGNKLDAALRSTLPDVDAVAQLVSQYESATVAGQYTQVHAQLSDLEQSLASYLNSLRPSAGAQNGRNQPGTGETNGSAPETERIAAPSSAPPPATTATIEEAGYMTQEQVKALLHRIYMATFRLNDLLGQVQPGRWKVPEPVRDHFNLGVTKFRTDLKTLEASRSEFAEQTDSAYAGYETYEALPALVADLDAVDPDIKQFEARTLAKQLDQPVRWLDESRQTLKAYLDFMLHRGNQVVRTYEANLASCQNTLNYAMRAQAVPVRPMEPVRFVRPLQSAKIRKKEAEEAARQTEHPADTSGSESATSKDQIPSDNRSKSGTAASKTPSAEPAKSKKGRKTRHAKKRATESAR